MALPGDIRKESCEDEGCYSEGCNARPTHSYCVEADSMGAEFSYWCDEHIAVVREHNKSRGPDIGICEGCGKNGVEIKPCRSWDEGHNGPVYDWCVECRQSNADDAHAAFDDMHDDDVNDDVDSVLNDLEDDGIGAQDPGPEEEYADNQWVSIRMVESMGYITPLRVELTSIAQAFHEGSILFQGYLSDIPDPECDVPVTSAHIMGILDLSNGQLKLLESSDDLYDDFFNVFHFVRKIRRYGFPVAFVRKTEKLI